MSVLACSRIGCYNIMCDNMSHKWGYLCDSCKQELISLGECRIEDFMNSEKKTPCVNNDWEDYINNIFLNRFDEDEGENNE